MKTVQLSIRGCSKGVYGALKKKAATNRRSINSEALIWLEREAEQSEPIGARQFAKNLRAARKLMSEAEHKAFAKDIQEGIGRMRRERLH